MTNPYCNHITANGETLIDLRSDTVMPSDVVSGKTFHDASGIPQTGTHVSQQVWFTQDSFDIEGSNNKFYTFFVTKPDPSAKPREITLIQRSTYTASTTGRFLIYCMAHDVESSRKVSYCKAAYAHETAKANYHVVNTSQSTVTVEWQGKEDMPIVPPGMQDDEMEFFFDAEGFSENVYFKADTTYELSIVWTN